MKTVTKPISKPKPNVPTPKTPPITKATIRAFQKLARSEDHYIQSLYNVVLAERYFALRLAESIAFREALSIWRQRWRTGS